MKTLKQVKADESALLFQDRGDGKKEYCPPDESDMELNEITRMKIVAFANENKECWLGNINLYENTRNQPVLTQYIQGETTVYNFSYKFMIPCNDELLIKMIQERDQAPYTGTKEDGERIDKIFDRISELGGEHLQWT